MTFQDGWFLTPGTTPSFDPADPPDAFNPFGSGGPTPTFGTVTLRSLIDSARVRHWAFSDIEMPDGAAVLYLNQRQREHLAMGGPDIEGIVGTAVQYAVATPSTGLLVSFVGGVPYVGAAGQDGWCMHEDENGVPYVDPNEPPLASDPLGDTPGWPLPQEMTRLVNVMLVQQSGAFASCTVVNERMRNATYPGRGPAAFVANNRLNPMRAYDTASASSNSGDWWTQVTGIQISWVGISPVSALDDELTLPVALSGALIADLALLFAMQSKQVSSADRRDFGVMAQQAQQQFVEMAFGMLGATMASQVQYRNRG